MAGSKKLKKTLHDPIYHIKAAKLKIHDDNKFYYLLLYSICVIFTIT